MEVPNERQARAWAIHYVRSRLRQGYNSECAEREAFLGQGGPNEPGYCIRRGKVTVPGLHLLHPHWTFRFAELEGEILNPPAKPRPDFQIPLPLLFQ
ncbi:MAG: hypothetical protein EOP86_16445 [Verrucomicrobiaceae bacterium]|nr:MAG: hypothetical protein EOP86_16445 [Verrucomicrobiaceae bacterium]